MHLGSPDPVLAMCFRLCTSILNTQWPGPCMTASGTKSSCIRQESKLRKRSLLGSCIETVSPHSQRAVKPNQACASCSQLHRAGNSPPVRHFGLGISASSTAPCPWQNAHHGKRKSRSMTLQGNYHGVRFKQALQPQCRPQEQKSRHEESWKNYPVSK